MPLFMGSVGDKETSVFPAFMNSKELYACSKVNMIFTILKSILIRFCFFAIIYFIPYNNHYDQ